MSKTIKFLSSLAVLVIAVTLGGCNGAVVLRRAG